jgi:hypothetical protein
MVNLVVMPPQAVQIVLLGKFHSLEGGLYVGIVEMTECGMVEWRNGLLNGGMV